MTTDEAGKGPVEDLGTRLRAKYDASAADYSRRYADPGAVAAGQLRLVRSWGSKVPPGSTVLEIGCADGFVTEHLVRAGYRVTALDISPEMIRVAGERLARCGLKAELIAADLGCFVPDRRYDVVMALTGNLFGYVEDPAAVLRRLAGATHRKFLVDFNPRTTSRSGATTYLNKAGFGSVRWRPLFVPQMRRTGPVLSAGLRMAERTPVLRDAMLKRWSKVVLKGEHA